MASPEAVSSPEPRGPGLEALQMLVGAMLEPRPVQWALVGSPGPWPLRDVYGVLPGGQVLFQLWGGREDGENPLCGRNCVCVCTHVCVGSWTPVTNVDNSDNQTHSEENQVRGSGKGWVAAASGGKVRVTQRGTQSTVGREGHGSSRASRSWRDRKKASSVARVGRVVWGTRA